MHSFELWNKCFAEMEAGNFEPPIVKNEKGEILAPNGMVSRLPNEDFVKVTRTPTFKAWFGDWVNDLLNSSKVVYRNTGEPMVVYHGTKNNIPLESGLLPSSNEAFYAHGKIYFSSYKDVVVEFSSGNNDRTSIFSCFLKICIPYSVSNHHELLDIVQSLPIQKFDGIIQTPGDLLGMHGDQYAVWSPENAMHTPSEFEGRKVTNRWF